MADSHLVRILKAEMARRGLTQHALARAAGLSPDTVRDIFRKKSGNPRITTLQALATYLQITVEQLMGGQALEVEQSGGDAVPRIPERKPGVEEWEEVQRVWNAASPDGRRAIVYMARTIARAEGVGEEDRDEETSKGG